VAVERYFENLRRFRKFGILPKTSFEAFFDVDFQLFQIRKLENREIDPAKKSARNWRLINDKQ
jgi:hypothetical protein